MINLYRFFEFIIHDIIIVNEIYGEGFIDRFIVKNL